MDLNEQATLEKLDGQGILVLMTVKRKRLEREPVVEEITVLQELPLAAVALQLCSVWVTHPVAAKAVVAECSDLMKAGLLNTVAGQLAAEAWVVIAAVAAAAVVVAAVVAAAVVAAAAVVVAAAAVVVDVVAAAAAVAVAVVEAAAAGVEGLSETSVVPVV